jgi:hypothetical protein
MIDETRQWRLPVQAAPVDRTPGSAARNGGSGVEPSDWFSDLMGTLGPAIPGILGAFGI